MKPTERKARTLATLAGAICAHSGAPSGTRCRAAVASLRPRAWLRQHGHRAVRWRIAARCDVVQRRQQRFAHEISNAVSVPPDAVVLSEFACPAPRAASENRR
jgi:hypothetical protein